MSTKKKPAKPEILRETIQAEYRFTDKEKQELGYSLAGLNTRRGELKNEKAQIVSQYAAREKEIGAQIDLISNKLTSGVEIRPTTAIVEYDVKRGMKIFLHDDRKKDLIREEPMTPSDYQLPMFKKEEIEVKKPETVRRNDPTLPKGFAIIEDGVSQEGDLALNVERTKWQKIANPGANAKDYHGLARKVGVPAEGEKKPEATNAGKLSLGDALTAAAAGVELPQIDFIANEISLADPKRFLAEFKRAAKGAGWPEACIVVMRDVLKGADTMATMQATLQPHIIPEEKPEPEKDDFPA